MRRVRRILRHAPPHCPTFHSPLPHPDVPAIRLCANTPRGGLAGLA